jgi:hypothetical protein
MAQRRNSSGRGGDQSGLFDVKALAAKARSETGGPVVRPNPAELSGVRPRRESVVGIRVTPPPRAASSELPNWLWGVLGCLSVLLIGFAALFFLGRSGKLGALEGDAVALAPSAAPPPPAPGPVVVEEPTPKEPEAPARPEHSAGGEHAARAERHPSHAAPAPEPAAPEAPAAPAEPPAAAAPSEPAAPAVAEEAAAAKRPARAAGAKARAAKGDAPAGADDDSSAAAEQPKVAAKAAAAEADDGDDSAPGQDDVERALDALAPKVRGCFVKYQIKGTARVRLIATPAGKAESVNVTGDFEDTPTGLCVESILSEAKLPSFKGAPLKLSQSYQLR